RTISPLRLRKIQDQDENSEVHREASRGGGGGANQSNSSTNESEADRALTVVIKKLSKTLSVEATVNELIQTASDTKNLAVLYSGTRPLRSFCLYLGEEGLTWRPF